MVKIKDIAEKANVSAVTVSMVLNNRADKMRISKETQKKVRLIADEMGYQPNISALRLQKSAFKTTPVIAIFWPIQSQPMLLERFFSGIQDYFIKSDDNDIEIIVHPYIRNELYKITSLKTNSFFNGAVILSPMDNDLKYLEENTFKMPIVLFNRKSDKYSNVCVDDYESGMRAAKLFASRGHKRVAFIAPQNMLRNSFARKDGFIDGCKLHGLQISSNDMIYDDDTMLAGGVAAKKIIESKTKPTALFFLVDSMVGGILPNLLDAGIRIPEDIEIVAYGNYPFAKYFRPSISSIHIPVEEMSNMCLKILINSLENNKKIVSKKYEGHFIFRQSCNGFIL